MEASFWLPGGLALGALLVFDRRDWWMVIAAVFLGDALYNFFGAAWPWTAWFVVTVGNALSALVGAGLFRRFVAPRATLASVGELGGLLACSGISLMLTSTIGAWTIQRLAGGQAFGEIWLSWYASDLLGVILVTPLIIAWKEPWWKTDPERWSVRLVELLVIVALVGAGVTFAIDHPWLQNPSARFFVVPCVIWSAIRVGARGVSLLSVVVALLAGWYALRFFAGTPLSQASSHVRNATLQVDLLLMAFFGLVPAIAIDAQRRAGAELRAQKNFLQAIFDNELDCIKIIAADGALVDMNRAGLALIEAESVEDARAHGLLSFVRPEFRARFTELTRRVLTGETGSLHYPIQGKRGAARWLEALASPLRDGEGRVHALLVVSRDGTAARRAEEALRLARFTVDHASLAMLWVREDAAILDANAAAARMLGYEVDELRRLRVADVDPEFSRERWPHHWAELKQARSIRFPSRQRRKDGVELDVIVSTHFLDLGEREISCAFVQDVTEQKRANDALRKHENELQLLFSAVADGIVVKDHTLAIVRWNAAAERILGLSAAEISGRTSFDPRWRAVREDGSAFPAEEQPAAVALRKKQSVRAAVMGVHKPNGALVWISVNAEPMPDALTGSTMVVSSFSDITASRALQEQIRQAQKTHVVGQLAGGMAHDFNNILTAMMLNLGLIKADAQLAERLRPPLEDVEEMTRRAARLTEQLLLFSRRRVMQTESLDLNTTVGQVVGLLRRVLGEPIRIDLELEPQALWIKADPSLLDQVVMNLCVNARDAMPAGGTLTLRTTRAEFATSSAEHPAARMGQFACLRITDTGIGMNAEVMSHLFEPFFTTKEVGRGTGLGLATVHGIVHQHEGWVEVQSAPGKGSTFLIYVPAAERTLPPPVEAPVASVRGGGETILIAEDEAPVRLAVSIMLRRLGYRVFEAPNASEALALWDQHHHTVALLLTDMVMPGSMTGLELSETLRRMKPSLGVIIMSGYTDQILKGGELRAAGTVFLAKPFEPAQLASAVRHQLDAVTG